MAGCGSLQVVVAGCGSLQVVVAGCGSLWVVPHFSMYAKIPPAQRIPLTGNWP